MNKRIVFLSKISLFISGMLFLSSCGGGGGDGGTVEPSFQDGRPSIELRIVPSNATVPLNPGVNAAYYPSAAEPYTVAIGATVTLGDVRTTAESINFSFKGNSRILNLFTFLVDDMRDDCPDPNGGTETVKCHGAFANYVFENSSSSTGYFVAAPRGLEGIGGKQVVLIEAVIKDRNGNLVKAQREVEITVGNPTELPSQSYTLVKGGGTIVAPNTDEVQFRIVDKAGVPVVGSRSYNSVQLELDDVSFRAGGRLTGVDFSGKSVTSNQIQLSTVENGVANFVFTAPNVDGISRVQVMVDTADNNVSNGIQQPLSLGYITYNVRKLSVAERITFTGDFAQAAVAGKNYLDLDKEGKPLPGTGIATYERTVSVRLTDLIGRPAGSGDKVNFYLVDGPLVGFPENGRGEFIIQGGQGNVQSSSNVFLSTDPASSFPVTGPNQILPNLCHLVYGYGLATTGTAIIADSSYAPYERGIRQITSRPSIPLLISELDPVRVNVDRQFNPLVETNFTVPWAVGCGGTVGALSNNGSAVVDSEGYAHLRLSYPINQIGRRFVLVAEYIRPDGNVLSALMNYWYISSEQESTLNIAPKVIAVSESMQAEVVSESVSLRLLNEDGLPLPNVRLYCQIALTTLPTDCDRLPQSNTDPVFATCQGATFRWEIAPTPIVTSNDGYASFNIKMSGWPAYVGATKGTPATSAEPAKAGEMATTPTKADLSCATINSNTSESVKAEISIK